MADKTINTRIVLRNDSLDNWLTSTTQLLKGEVALAFNGDAVQVAVGDGSKTWSQLRADGKIGNLEISAGNVVGLSDYVKGLSVDTNTTYRIVSAELSTGETGNSFKLQRHELSDSDMWYDVEGSRFNVPAFNPSEIEARLDNVEDSLSDAWANLSGDGEGSVNARINAAADDALAALSVTVEKLATAEDGYLATYIVKQGGTKKGESINIPKDFLVKSASVKKCDKKDDPISGLNPGDPYIDFVINTKDGTGTDEHLYINVKDLVDVYEPGETDTVKVEIENNVISASVKDGSIGAKHLATELSGDIAGVIAAQAADREAIETLSGDETTDGSVKKALADANAYTDGKISALDATITAGTTDSGARKVFTQIVEEDGVLTSFVAAQLSTSDIAGFGSDVSAVAAAYADAEKARALTVEAALGDRLSAVEEVYLSGVTLNGQTFEVTNHVATLTFNVINGGAA